VGEAAAAPASETSASPADRFPQPRAVAAVVVADAARHRPVPVSSASAQRALAREAGFRSWPELVQYVEARRGAAADRRARCLAWAVGNDRTGHRLAARALADEPELVAGDPWLACIAGDASKRSAAHAVEPASVA